MATGMAMIGGGILWSTQVPVHGRFLASLAGPFFVVGAGTAFAFIPVSIAATHASPLLRQGAAPAAALTSGFQWAFWACGVIGLAGVPVTYLLVRRNELAKAVARTSQKPQPVPADV